MAELHVHGGRAVITAVLAALCSCPGLRLAEPGEFTRRAFENGRLDLAEAEGLADLVQADTAAQRRQALRQLGGELSRLYEEWRKTALDCLAHFEAAIDFVDDDLPAQLTSSVRSKVAALRASISNHLADGGRGERLREGIHVAILGSPNVGKSSLLNLLAKREAAIVSETAGTTRDVIEVHLDLDGYPVVVADTAGLREPDAPVEREGIRRARQKAEDADLKLAVLDATSWPRIEPEVAALVDEDSLVAVNKTDIVEPIPPLVVKGREALAVSALTGKGIDCLLERLIREVKSRFDAKESPTLTRLRHRLALEDCVSHLDRFLTVEEHELAAEDLRLSARALGRVTGRMGVEEVLDAVFRDFCIGK